VVESIRDILKRAGNLAGTDLVSIYESRRGEIEDEVDRIRKELPNTLTRKRFDRELDQQSKQQRKAKQRQTEALRNNKSNRRALARLEKKLRDEGIEDPKPRLIPAHLWKQCRHILADHSGWAARYYSKLCYHKVGVSYCHRAALCYDENGIPKYSYVGNSREACRARFVLASGLLILCLAKPTGRRGQGWTRLVSGIPQDAILTALRDPFSGKRPSSSSFNGTHHKTDDKEVTDGNVGYLTALKRVGLLYTRQTKTAEKHLAKNVKGWENIRPEEQLGKRTKTGLFCSLARYWVVSDVWTDPVDAAKRARLWVAWLGGVLPESVDFDPETFAPTSEPEKVTSTQARASPA
jgi:hypothetical protein